MEVRAMTAQTIKAPDGKKRTRRAAKRIRAAMQAEQTPPLEVRIAAVIRDAASSEPGEWLYDVMGTVLERWGCDSDACPGRPEWDRARSALYEDLAARADGRMSDLVDELAAEWAVALETYVGAHPEAPLAA
jgi:hypothetical protein